LVQVNAHVFKAINDNKGFADGDVQELARDLLGDVGLTAVFAHLGRNLVHHHRLAVAMERDGGSSRPGLSMMANDAVHRVVLRVLKSGSHSADRVGRRSRR